MKYHLRALDPETNNLIAALEEYPPIVVEALDYVSKKMNTEIQAVGVLQAWDDCLDGDTLDRISGLFFSEFHWRRKMQDAETTEPTWDDQDRAWIIKHDWVVVSEEKLLG